MRRAGQSCATLVRLQTTPASSPPWFRRARPARIWIGAILLLLLLARLALPFALERVVNRRLAALPGYSGRVEDVDLQLFRGAGQLHRLAMEKRADGTPEQSLHIDTIDLSLAWGELLRGRIMGDLLLDGARLRLARGAAPPPDLEREARDWRERIERLLPIEIARFELRGGEFRFVDPTSSPRVDVAVRDLQAEVTGLRNRSVAASGGYPVAGRLTGRTVGEGRLEVRLQADPLAPQPRFDLKLELSDVDLPALNDFLQAYAGVDVSSGLLDVSIEVLAADGRYEGYVKPLVENAVFENLADRDKNPLRRLWESAVSAVTEIVTNESSGKAGTRMPFAGTFEDTDVGLWATLVNLLRNGFGRALAEGVDGEVPSPKEE